MKKFLVLLVASSMLQNVYSESGSGEETPEVAGFKARNGGTCSPECAAVLKLARPSWSHEYTERDITPHGYPALYDDFSASGLKEIFAQEEKACGRDIAAELADARKAYEDVLDRYGNSDHVSKNSPVNKALSVVDVLMYTGPGRKSSFGEVVAAKEMLAYMKRVQQCQTCNPKNGDCQSPCYVAGRGMRKFEWEAYIAHKMQVKLAAIDAENAAKRLSPSELCPQF